MKILGFEFRRAHEETVAPLPTDASENNASVVVDNTPGGFMANVSAISIDNQSATENGFIEQYRSMVYVPEVQQCVNEIVSDAIVYPDDGGRAVELDMSNVKVSDSVKKKFIDAHEYVYDLLMFNRRGHDIFKRWYVDGRLNYFVNIDPENPSAGIQSIQYVDPRKIKKVREIQRAYDKDSRIIQVIAERTYFLYNEQGLGSTVSTQTGVTGGANNVGMRSETIISEDSVVYVPSGEVDPQSGFVLSYLHGAIRTANNLRMMEDSALIYRLSRAPERRIFYIDTGNLPKAKGDQYVQEIANKNRSKIVYDATSGEIKNDKKFLALTEDFWIPRREGSTGTQIDTLPGGTQVGEMGEAEYFKEKLYTALNVPSSRFQDQPSMFGVGTAITRDELRFSRMIDRLRANFSVLFEELVKRQCLLTNVVSLEDWELLRNQLHFKFAADNHFTQAVEAEELRSTAELLGMLDPFVGKYFSREFIYTKVIGMTDDEMKREQKLIAADPAIQPPDPEADPAAAGQTNEGVGHMKTVLESLQESDVNSFIDSFISSLDEEN